MNGEPIMWSPGVTLDAIERQVILKAYQFYKQNKTATSIALGIAIRTLDNKFERYAADDKAEIEAYESRKANRETFLARSRGLSNPAQHDTAATPRPEVPRQQEAKAHGDSPTQGFRAEPVKVPAAQRSLSMSESQEVQIVLPKQTASGGQRGRR